MTDHSYFLDALWANTPDVVICLDKTGTIRCANPQAYRTFAGLRDASDESVDDLKLTQEDGRPFAWREYFSDGKTDYQNNLLTYRPPTNAPLSTQSGYFSSDRSPRNYFVLSVNQCDAPSGSGKGMLGTSGEVI